MTTSATPSDLLASSADSLMSVDDLGGGIGSDRTG